MAQTIEYPMFTPHPKAKLYKRLTNDMAVKLKDGDVVTIQNNRYVCVGKFKWIESTTKQETAEQPLDGLLIPNSYITVKTNSLKTFNDGDVVELPKGTPLAGFWIVMSGQETAYVYTPKPVQTYRFLSLTSAGLR